MATFNSCFCVRYSATVETIPARSAEKANGVNQSLITLITWKYQAQKPVITCKFTMCTGS